MSHEKLETREQWINKIDTICSQLKMAEMDGAIKCGCGTEHHVENAFRCLYCLEWYCMVCAEKHFGKTREEYRKEDPAPDFAYDLLAERMGE